MSLLTDVQALMTGVSNISIGSMPDTPDNSVCLYLTGGYARSLSGTMVEEPTFQVRVRNTSYETGESLCCTIKDLLHGKNNTGKFLMIEQQSDVMELGRDTSERSEWTINFRCLYRR